MIDRAITLEFLFILCVAVPALILWGVLREGKSDKPTPSKDRMRRSTILNQMIFGSLGIVTALVNHMNLFPQWHASGQAILVGALLLTFWLTARTVLLPRLRTDRPSVLKLLSPKSWADLRYWSLLSLSAGIFEEISFRGVLYNLILSMSRDVLFSVIAGSLVFAVWHASQGLYATVFIFFLAISFQVLVWYTGNLYTAMTVHVLYDLLVGVQAVRFPAKEPEPVVSCPSFWGIAFRRCGVSS